MKHLIVTGLMLIWAPFGWALSPYTWGEKLPEAELGAQLKKVEQKLKTGGFTVVGRHTPKGIPGQASVIVTDSNLLKAIGELGGTAIVAAPIRVGVDQAGAVSYTNPEYWYRAYLQGQFPKVAALVKATQDRLRKTLGDGAAFGGDVPVADLAEYRYMASMEQFDSYRHLLFTAPSFEIAVKTIRENLAKGVADTAVVYEIVQADSRQAVFGVAMQDSFRGDAWWVNKLGANGPKHIAALPYEIFVADNKVYSLYGRYRIALAWPALSMGDFMNIRYAPDVIEKTMNRVAGAPERGMQLAN